MKGWFAPDSRKRRILLGLAVYLVCTGVFFASAARDRITTHTPYNHYALLADSWLHGQLNVRGAPPPYAAGNDFAEFQGKWYVSFPPFPAVWLLPWVKIGGFVENVRDGQAFLWLAGVGPAVLFLVLEKLRRTGKSERSEGTNWLLALLFAFGTVYWFTAEQGTVWFAAHVVGVALSAIYLLCALDAEWPMLAGLMIGCAWLTRPPMLLLGIVFALEAFRVSLRGGFPERRGGSLRLAYDCWLALDVKKLLARWGLFLIPVIAAAGLTLWLNHAMFHKWFSFGHEYLTVAWRARIERWGLFSYHYLPRNLGIMLASLPFKNQSPPLFQINVHGLALWFTSPFYLWLLWPKKWNWQYFVYTAGALLVLIPDLLYQNSGWMQFGFRFSNDFAVCLIVLLAIGGRRFGKAFFTAAIIAVAVNAFGAFTFERAQFSKYYFVDGSQRTIFQGD
ncbi:MAG: hypothetical protein HY898_01875 [Deltaproteobacteria bacterium]|nr:hypothetical protein [Deltaproteobacteria bacterium]